MIGHPLSVQALRLIEAKVALLLINDSEDGAEGTGFYAETNCIKGEERGKRGPKGKEDVWRKEREKKSSFYQIQSRKSLCEKMNLLPHGKWDEEETGEKGRMEMRRRKRML